MFKPKVKRVKFHSVVPDLDIPRPMSASRLTPEWYRKMKRVKQGGMSVKTCVPFLDSITSGYILTLPVDMVWDHDAGHFLSQSKLSLNEDHYPDQISDMPMPSRLDPRPHKWMNQWHIKTPPGYSTLFVHPLNRLDLPFYSLSGIVDTDRHPLVVNFPFLLEKDFKGVIPAGTPIIQAIPFKRDDWVASYQDTGEAYYYPKEHEGLNPPFGHYKRNWWTRKTYSQESTNDKRTS